MFVLQFALFEYARYEIIAGLVRGANQWAAGCVEEPHGLAQIFPFFKFLGRYVLDHLNAKFMFYFFY